MSSYRLEMGALDWVRCSKDLLYERIAEDRKFSRFEAMLHLEEIFDAVEEEWGEVPSHRELARVWGRSTGFVRARLDEYHRRAAEQAEAVSRWEDAEGERAMSKMPAALAMGEWS